MTRCIALFLVLASCGGAAPASPERPAPGATIEQPPYTGARKLVVLLVLDQWPQWAFIEKAPALTQGFDRLLREGQWTTGVYPTPATLTAPGHALLATGESPNRSGILANEWWSREENANIAVTKLGDKFGAGRLRVPGLGDAVAVANTGAKAVTVGLKHRAALLMLGHRGTAVWYDSTNTSFVSSEPAPWLLDYNRVHPISSHLRDVWTPLDVTRLATLSKVTDAQKGEVGGEGLGPTFPHDAAKTTKPAKGITAMPLGNELTFDVARAAIAGEQLGADTATDYLAVSLSTHDVVHHSWGHESWESWDMTLRLDKTLGEFLTYLDTTVGVGAWSMVVTSDHGAAPLPDRIGGGRMVQDTLAVAANNAASTELGTGTWVHTAKYPYVWLTPAFHAKPNPDRSKAFEKIMRALRSFPGIATVDRTASYAGNCEQRTGDDAAICKMIDPERAGEIFFLPRRGWIFEDPDDPLATAHGSFYDYDREVPVILLPFGRTPHARATAPGMTMGVETISTLLATWLGVTPPLELPRK